MRNNAAPTLACGLLILAMALAFTVGCQDDETPAPTTAKTAGAPKPTAAKAPPVVSPHHLKLDDEGHLKEAADRVFGFRMPMGVEPYRATRGVQVLRIETTMERLVQFYTSREYHVIEHRGGLVVRHSKETRAELGDPPKAESARIYLQHAVGRLQEIRVFEGRDPEAPAGVQAPTERNSPLRALPKVQEWEKRTGTTFRD